MKIRFLLAASAAALVVSSCGGGGGGGGSSSGGGTPTPPPPPPPANNAPQFTTATPAPVIEGSGTAAYTETASDADGDTLSFSIGGNDAAVLFINAATGEVTFRDIPDYENPADSVRNNIYVFTVTVSDGEDSVTADRQIEVVNAFESVSILPVPSEFNGGEYRFSTTNYVEALNDINGDGAADITINPYPGFATQNDGTVAYIDALLLGSLDGEVLRTTDDFVAGPGGSHTVWITGDLGSGELIRVQGGGEVTGDDSAELFFRRLFTLGGDPILEMANGASLPDFGDAAVTVSEATANGTDFTSAGDSDFASIMRVLGDVNGDGRNDILLTDCAGCSDMEIVIVPGESVNPPADVAVDTIPFTANGARFRWNSTATVSSFRSIVSLGDLDGDGRAETAIGNPDANPDPVLGPSRGSVYVAFGSDFGSGPSTTLAFPDDVTVTEILGETDPSSFSFRIGAAVANAGDIDGDGLNDLFIQSSSNISYVVYGRAIAETAGMTTFVEASTQGTDGFSISGDLVRTVVALGDINGDGQGDLAIQAGLGTSTQFLILDGEQLTGKADGQWTLSELVSSGAALPIVSAGYQNVDTLAPSGDLNADGLGDVVLLGRIEPFGEKARDIIAVSGAYTGDLMNDGQTEIDLTGFSIAP